MIKVGDLVRCNCKPVCGFYKGWYPVQEIKEDCVVVEYGLEIYFQHLIVKSKLDEVLK